LLNQGVSPGVKDLCGTGPSDGELALSTACPMYQANPPGPRWLAGRTLSVGVPCPAGPCAQRKMLLQQMLGPDKPLPLAIALPPRPVELEVRSRP
jgi:hypothetical protein